MLSARDDADEVIAWRVGDVGVDLARAEPADAGTAVDRAQPDSMSCDAARSRAAGHSLARLGRARHLLSPSWPSAIRLTDAFGTGSSMPERTPDLDQRPLDGTGLLVGPFAMLWVTTWLERPPPPALTPLGRLEPARHPAWG